MNAGQPRSPDTMQDVALSQAFVVPPPGGPAMVEILEKRYPNATEQKIFLRSEGGQEGQNFLLVQYFGPVGNSGTGRDRLKNPPVSIGNIGREMREEFPNIQMARSPTFVQNRYGPFGYAVGRSSTGDTCLYAWQRIAGTSSLPVLFRDKGTIQLRLRQCAPGNSENRLLSTMYGLTIKAFFSDITWDPYPAPTGADPRLGTTGSPIYPTGAGGFERVVDTEPEESEPAARRTPAPRRIARRAPAPEPAELPAPIGPAVPAPPGATTASVPSEGESAATAASPSRARPAGAASPTLTGPAVPPPPPGATN